jgi:hypothetical protein
MKRQVLLLISFIGITTTGILAQDAILTSGGRASGNGGTVNYTVGQIAYSTNSGTNGSVVEGIQQPYEISVISGIEHSEINLATISANPNPVVEYLNLNITENSIDSGKYMVSLYDVNGKLLQTQKITIAETKIEMSQYKAGTYFLRVLSGDQLIKNFKIIKQ